MVAVMLITRPIEESQKVDPSKIDSIDKGGYSFRIPMMMGLGVPIGQLASIGFGTWWFTQLARSQDQQLYWPGVYLFAIIELYMFMPATVIFKTVYGILIGMPLLWILMSYMMYKNFFPMYLSKSALGLIILGVMFITIAACFLCMVVDDVKFYRIVLAVCLQAGGVVCLEIGYWKAHDAVDKEKILLVESVPDGDYGSTES